jgi:hypothetical protein
MLSTSAKLLSASSSKQLFTCLFSLILRIRKVSTHLKCVITFSQFLLALVIVISSVNVAQAEIDNSPAIKTGFLYNFFKFIEWPNPGDSYRLCATSNTGLESFLITLDAKLVNNKPIKVLTNVENQALKNCDLVFIGPSENTEEINAILRGLPIVTVSDNLDFIKQGGMIELIEIENRLAFELNMDTIKTAGIHISAQMLKLAKNVIATQ